MDAAAVHHGLRLTYSITEPVYLLAIYMKGESGVFVFLVLPLEYGG